MQSLWDKEMGKETWSTYVVVVVLPFKYSLLLPRSSKYFKVGAFTTNIFSSSFLSRDSALTKTPEHRQKGSIKMHGMMGWEQRDISWPHFSRILERRLGSLFDRLFSGRLFSFFLFSDWCECVFTLLWHLGWIGGRKGCYSGGEFLVDWSNWHLLRGLILLSVRAGKCKSGDEFFPFFLSTELLNRYSCFFAAVRVTLYALKICDVWCLYAHVIPEVFVRLIWPNAYM